jgi:serine/threonine-protein kinase
MESLSQPVPAPLPIMSPVLARRLPWAVAAAFAALAALGLRRPPAPAPQVVHLSLAPPPGVVPEAEIVTQTQLLAMSSDGRRVAFRGRKGEDARLYVRDLARESAEPVPGTEGGEQPFFSPDGEWLGFFANGKLRKTAVRGGTPVVLTDISAPRGAAWGPDGTIVYTPSYGSALMRISGDGGDPKPLTALDAATRERTHRWPEVLPDGDTVLFTVGTEDKPGDYDDSRIEAVSLATGKRRVVWSGASVARFAPPDHLLIARHGDLLSVDFDARSARARGTPSPVLQGVSGDSRSGVAYFGVARNGTLVYATGLSPQGRNEIVWVDRQGRRTPTGIPPGVYSKVALSPDGTKVAYGEGPSGGARSDVWVADLVHGGQLQLTSDGRANSPAWSPDGKQIFCSTPQGDAVVRLSADGTAAPEVVWKSPFRVPIRMDSVTPDGSTLFVTLNGLPTLADIYRIPLRGGGTPGPFIATPGSDIAGMISPNGRWIAYSAEAGIGSVLGQIFVQPYPSLAGRWQVSRSGGSSPVWSRDGTELFFMGPKGELWSAPVRLEPTFAPGEPKPVVKLELPGSTEWGDVYDVAPDARRFLALAPYREDASAPRIDVILGFTARLTR